MAAARHNALFSVRGAYTQLEQLLALHHCARGLRLAGARPGAAPLAGEWQTRRRGRGVDFDEVRLYQPGDDIRSIDWRVTARSQHPHTKVYREERERPVMLAADLRSPLFFGSACFKSVYGAALLSALAWVALGNRDRVGGVVFGDDCQRDFRPRRSKHTVLNWLRQLDNFSHRLESPCPDVAPQPLNRLLETLTHTCRPGTALYIASDFHDLDDESHRRLHQLARHGDVSLCVLVDPLEQALPEDRELWVSDGRQRRLLRGAHALAPDLEARLERLGRWCGALGIALHRCDTDSPLSVPLGRLCTGVGPW